MAKEYPLIIDAGEGLKFVFFYRQKTTRVSLIPAGSTATMELHDTSGLGTPIILSTENGDITLDPDTGRTVTIISQAAAAALPFREANYKWYLHRPDGTRKKLLFGVARKV